MAEGDINVKMQDYVEASIEPLADRIRKGDVTLREYLEQVIKEHRIQVDQTFVQADVREQERLRILDSKIDERWARVEEQIERAERLSLEYVAQLRRERELVTRSQTIAIDKAQEATKIAIEKAEIATEKRFESVNEFRAQQSDLLAKFMSREVVEAKLSDMQRTIDDIRDKLSKIT